MDHKTATETMAVERYLLDEFAPDERDAFEEHFFSCDDCAEEIKTAAALMAHGREIFHNDKLAEKEAELRSSVAHAKPVKRVRFAWLWPNFALPAMALMLGVVVFQNLVQFPEMRQSIAALDAPAVLTPPLYLASGATRGDTLPSVVAAPGQPFLLLIDFDAKSGAAHTAELYDSAGQRKWTLLIPENSPTSNLPLRVPSGNLPAGTYTLIVRSAVAGTTPSEAAKYDFNLHRP